MPDVLTEEEQVEALIKNKGGKPSQPAPEPTPKEGDDDPDDNEKDAPKKDGDDAPKDEPELTEDEIKEKFDSIKDKDEKDLTEEDKAFLEKYTDPVDEDEDLTPDAYIEAQFGKYDIKTEKDLLEFIDTAVDVVKERDDLKKKLEAAKEPQYKSEAQRKVAEFLEKTGFEPSKFAEGLHTYTQVMTMDLDDNQMAPKLVLEADYIIKHPELTRAEAQRKFSKEYEKKFVVSRDNYDDDDSFKEAEEDARIEVKSAVAKAIKSLKKVQEEYRTAPSEKETAPKIDPSIAKSIEHNTSLMEDHFKEADQIVFSPTENEDDDFAYKFSKDQINNIRAVCKSILDNPGSYDAKGKLVYAGGVEEVSRRVADFLYGDEFRDKLFEHASTITAAKRLEDAGKVKPDRKGQRQAAPIDKGNLSEEDQIQMMIDKKKAASKR